MRLFVAFVPPPDALAELERATATLRPAWPGLRWTSREAWHITLAFLGEVPEQVLPELTVRLERAARRHSVLDLAVAGAGAFPAAGRARVLWAGVRADRAALRALAGSVAAGARRAGAPSPDEGRRYRPHITLARLREPADVRPLTATLADLATAAWTATSIGLIRSHLGSSPRYEPLATWPLKASPEAAVKCARGDAGGAARG
jgi:RNA 2',3'-cyclic 3'-phosphodiesterase